MKKLFLIIFVILLFISCLRKNNSEKPLEKVIAYEKLMNSNTEEMDLHPALVAEKFLSITKAKDFENTYFKLQFLLFFDLATIDL